MIMSAATITDRIIIQDLIRSIILIEDIEYIIETDNLGRYINVIIKSIAAIELQYKLNRFETISVLDTDNSNLSICLW